MEQLRILADQAGGVLRPSEGEGDVIRLAGKAMNTQPRGSRRPPFDTAGRRY